MDSVQHDEAAPLIVDVEDGSSLKLNSPKNHARDVHILSVAFLFIFSAYHAAQNLESTVNTVSSLDFWACSVILSGLVFV